MQPALALGQAVHNVLDVLASLPSEERFNNSLHEMFEDSWLKISGEKGGFKSTDEEIEYKERGVHMIANLIENPGILKNKTIKLPINKDLPHLPPNFVLSESDNLILCGKIDWIEYLSEDDTVHIVDFKTGKHESEDSLQLPIYLLLASNLQRRRVKKASYWFVSDEIAPNEIDLPEIIESQSRVLKASLHLKREVNEGNLVCPHGGCFACKPYEIIYSGGGKKIGESDSKQDIYIV